MDTATTSNSNSTKDEILMLSDDSGSCSDEDNTPSMTKSTNSSLSKQSIQNTLTKFRMNRNIAIKKGALQKAKDITDIYEFQDKIGEGNFGKVYKAVHRETGQVRAIKLIYKKRLDSTNIVITEIQSLMKLDHPNLVKLIEYYETKSKIFLVQEFL